MRSFLVVLLYILSILIIYLQWNKTVVKTVILLMKKNFILLQEQNYR